MINYYHLLQVTSNANTTVMRYAYRYLAAMYHPDNAETADTEKFKLVTEAWRVLSDPNKRNAYDLQLGVTQLSQPAAAPPVTGTASAPQATEPAASQTSGSQPPHGEQSVQGGFGPPSTPACTPVGGLAAALSGAAAPAGGRRPAKGTSAEAPAGLSVKSTAAPATGVTVPVPDGQSRFAEPKPSTSWSEVDLRLAVLQILLDAKRKKPQIGGASAKMLMDCLGVELIDLEYMLWYLREKRYIDREEAQFTITIDGVDYLVDQLSKTEILNPVRSSS